ncbi:MAG: hypothetical protein IKR13_06575 [Victivallales bacterium]|nr:hypothetical protein [Victivallales bacterium]
MTLKFKMVAWALCFAMFVGGGLQAEPSETACSAKCCNAADGISIDKDALQEMNDDWEAKIIERRDDLVVDLKDFLLDEEEHPSEEYQERLHDKHIEWDEDIASVDFNQVQEDTRTILREAEEWISSLDLPALREDAEKQVDYYRLYTEDYRTIKDDFVNGRLGDCLETFLEGFGLTSNFKSKWVVTPQEAGVSVKTNGLNPVSTKKKNSARIRSLVNECKERFEEIKEERRADYEELKEKYRAVHQDFKNKKRRWKEMRRAWRHRESESDDDESDY